MVPGLLRGVGILRLVTFAILVATVITERDSLRAVALVWVLVGLAAAVTALTTWLNVTRPAALTGLPVIGIELAVGAALLLLDGVVFKSGHVGSTQAGLAGSWPIAGVLSAGIAFGSLAGLGAGILMGVAHILAAPLNGVTIRSAEVPAFVTSLVLYAICGVAAGYAVSLIRAYDDNVAQSRAREEVGRTLHDGVLQTLAVIERRSSDPELATLARDQERELRAYLSGSTAPATPNVRWPSRPHRERATELRASVQEMARAQLKGTPTRASVLVAEDAPALSARTADALLGAIGESLANVAKHAHAANVTIYLEPVGRSGVFCSIKDDGIGFDSTSQCEGFGLTNSVRRRIEGVGGTVEVVATVSGGTEVRLWT